MLFWIVLAAASLFLLLRLPGSRRAGAAFGWGALLAAGFGLANALLQPVQNFWVLLGFAAAAGWMAIRAAGCAAAPRASDSLLRAAACLAIAACIIAWNGGTATAFLMIGSIGPLFWMLFVRRRSATGGTSITVEERRPPEPLLASVTWGLLLFAVVASAQSVSTNFARQAGQSQGTQATGTPRIATGWPGVEIPALLGTGAMVWLAWSAAGSRSAVPAQRRPHAS